MASAADRARSRRKAIASGTRKAQSASDSRNNSKSSGGGSSKQVGLNDKQISLLRGMSGIDQGALNNYVSSGSAVGGRNNPRGRGREAITPQSLGSVDAVSIPDQPIPTYQVPDLGITNAGLGAGTDGMFEIPTSTVTDTDSANVANAKGFQDQLAGYLGLSAQLSKPVEGASEQALVDAREQAGVDKAQREFNRYSGELNAITAKRDADQLGLEGQGRGITDTLIGGQQARIGREAAIQALPVQAQLAAAQGNLEQAQALMGQLFTAKSADIAADQAYRTSLASSVMQFGTQTQQAILQAQIADSAEASAKAQQNLAYQRQLGMQALEYGQNGLITGISSVDPSSPTFEQDIAAYTSQLRKPVAAGSRQAPTTKVIGDDLYQYNYETGKWELAVGAGGGAEDGIGQDPLAQFSFLRESAQKVNELADGASPNPIAEFVRKGIGSSSTKNTQLQGYVDTLKANMLTLATDPSIKQFFGPQMSDADVRLMTAAGSNLRPDEQTPKQLREEVRRIDDLINRAETAVREGVAGNDFSYTTITAPDGTLIEIVE